MSQNPGRMVGPRFRRALVAALGAVLALAAAAPAAHADVTLAVAPNPVGFGRSVTASGAVTPAAQTPVELYRRQDAGWRLVAAGETGADGAFSLSFVARRPGELVARADGVESTPVRLRIRPRLTASFRGLNVLGARLAVRGRLVPAEAGVLRLTVLHSTRRVAVASDGRFEAVVPTRRAGRLRAKLAVDPAPGFVRTRRTLRKRIVAPVLSVGSGGPAVGFLERRLTELRYVVPGVNRRYAAGTRDAVYAFQKVEGLSVTGVVGPQVWRALRRARTPRALVPRGRHIEVDKGRQVVFEVRKGRVRRIVHVSTGATGNTPVGRWRIYSKTPGLNSLGMYYSMYFLRGFALHGYASVPTYPASHGCVRLPMWYARGIYDRWPVGSIVRVFA